ncbi:heterokaryon incompatibility protein-domain-containing protein [Hypoxylon argillaceum]|nr:heterokaryon incompatibility protein-domain-containing protein [Hypoxylon argillaceum]
MRLLNTTTLTLETFRGTDLPRYAILSHTWGEDEILFEDVQHNSFKQWRKRSGAAKVIDSAKKAGTNGFEYIWIDSCCIDSSSSAELSEAINSMFKWYRDSAVCYAYLSDVHPHDETSLQELIAPEEVEFFNSKWESIGTRHSLALAIRDITRIDVSLLKLGAGAYGLTQFSIYTRMTWAHKRKTTRPEDRAYSLMGIFHVNMPLLYGEGEHKAFDRLQGEIIRGSNDQSILLHRTLNLLANSPDEFQLTPIFHKIPMIRQHTLERVNFKIRASLLLYPLASRALTLGIIDSVFADDASMFYRPALMLERVGNEDIFYRHTSNIFKVRFNDEYKAEVIYTTEIGTDDDILTTIDQGQLQRKTVELRQHHGFTASTLLPQTQGLQHLCLRPIFHQGTVQLFKYAECYYNMQGYLVPIHFTGPRYICSDFHLVAAVSLPHIRRGEHYRGPLSSLNLTTHSIFPYLVNLQDWLGFEGSSQFNPFVLKSIQSELKQLPICRGDFTDGPVEIYVQLLKHAPRKDAMSRFLMSTPDGVEIAVSLDNTTFLEDDVLGFKAEISDPSIVNNP